MSRCTPWERCVWASLASILLPLLAAAQGTPAAPPQVAISPSRFELDISPQPTTESVRIMNLSDTPIEVQVSVVNWDLDEANQVRVLEPTEQSLDQWMTINPLHFTVAPGETQNVRFSIRPRVAPEPAEHRAMIYLDQVLGDEPKGGVRMRFQYGVAVYGQVGERIRKGTLHGIDVRASGSQLSAVFDISSEGTAHVRMTGQYAVWPADAFPGPAATTVYDSRAPAPSVVLQVGELPPLPVLPGCRRQLVLQELLTLAPGAYVLDINGDLSGMPLDRAVPFTVPGPAGDGTGAGG
jgi:hypothetical protein